MDCCICFTECSSDLFTLSCNHHFCKPCISQWAQTNPSCPCCRCEVEEDIQHRLNVVKPSDLVRKNLLSLFDTAEQ